MRHLFILFLLTSLSFLFGAVTTADVIHVPADQPTIQAGIDAAAAGDTVLVAPGIYSGAGNMELSFQGKAILVTSARGPAHCVIDAAGGSYGFRFENGEAEDSVVQGITIRNGESGGIYCH
jgi:hypothetical protein